MTLKASHTQRSMKEIEPSLKELREKHSKDQKILAQKTMELYKEKGVNPFSGCLPLFIQLPFLIALYQIVLHGLEIHNDLLYSFVPVPEILNLHIFSTSLAAQSIVFAVIAGASQFILAIMMSPNVKGLFSRPSEKSSNQEEFARSMSIQMLTIFPLMIGFISYKYRVAVALYLITSNIFGVAQELWVRQSRKTQ
jgi:YidC/Oxa1 family membrane protein insertase